MDVATAVGGTRSVRGRLTLGAVALMLAAGAVLLLLQQPADAQFQIPNLSAIVCPILLQVRNAFADSSFFNFIEPIISSLLQFFGCGISG